MNASFGRDLTDVVNDKEYWDDNFDEEKLILSGDKKRGTFLIWNDFSIMSVEYLQWLALVSIIMF